MFFPVARGVRACKRNEAGGGGAHPDVFSTLDGLGIFPQLPDEEVTRLVDALLHGNGVGPGGDRLVEVSIVRVLSQPMPWGAELLTLELQLLLCLRSQPFNHLRGQTAIT